MLEEFANLPGHALANTIDAGAALIQPDQLVKAAQQVYRDPQPAIQGLKDFGAEVAERPVALMEQLDFTDLIPGLAALPPGSNKLLKKLGKLDIPPSGGKLKAKHQMIKDPNNFKVLEEPRGFNEINFPHTQKVRVEFPDGDVIEDEIKGLNRGHALAIARENWPDTKVTPIE